MIEEFKDIKGYEGIYKISNIGRVLSCSRIQIRFWKSRNLKYKIVHKEKLLKLSNRLGYYCVCLHNKSGKMNSPMVHSIVAQTFIGERPEGYHVNHKDGNKLNNNINNLEYLTSSDNLKHAHKIGLINYSKVARTHTGMKRTLEHRKNMSISAKRAWKIRKEKCLSNF